MAKSLRFEAVYPFSRQQVWVALTDSDAIADWLMPNDFKAEVGHRFNFQTRPAPGFDGTVHCEVLTVDPPRRLAYSWKGGGIDTVVSYELSTVGESTRLVMEQSGFTGLRGMMVRRILAGGWKKMVAEGIPAAAARVEGGRYARDPDASQPQRRGR